MKRTFTSLFISALLAGGCTNRAPSSSNLLNKEFLKGLYVTRPEAVEPVITILKLKNPALLETAQRENGTLKVDPKLVQAIQQEQEELINELQKISPQIRVLIRYKLVLNGLAIWAPAEVYEKISALRGISRSEKVGTFSRPHAETSEALGLVGPKTSVNFIGSEQAYAQNLRGEGMKVGIIDTGIDYTHKMFLGEGTSEAYKNNDPAKENPTFPNKKVVGGIDLVGTEYNAASPDSNKRIPLPDLNPLDEAGHGTHVAGTVAGLGDGINTYSGVAPAADLYAIKVFGAKGSTSDEVVIAALEYAADPTGDLSFQQQLDIVNLSLGSGYGNPHIMYNQAIRNLVRGGTVVVAAAGNSGDKGYIVGAPGVSDDAISVASTIDNMNQNILFPSADFKFIDDTLNTEVIEGAITKPLEEFPELKGELIYLGHADTDFDSTLKDQIKGKIAFIDRGKVSFSEKIQRAQDSGAVAIVMSNNADSDPIVMGGEGKFHIPGVMISKKSGDMIKAKLQNGPVIADLKSSTKVEKPWLEDTISPFSSRGPRSDDGLIKPEIAAPGSNIISAKMGEGEKGVVNSGTSMASPHIAGALALLKQKYKDLSPQELKSLLLGHAKVISDENKNLYSVSRQGAGRVQVAFSLEAKVVTSPATLSFGITDIEKQKSLRKEVSLRNISSENLTLKGEWQGTPGLQISVPTITLAPGESKKLLITAKVSASLMKNMNEELDGYLKFSTEKAEVLRLPTLLVARQISQIKAESVKIHATSAADAAGSAADVVLHNHGMNKGTAYLFNLIGVDARKKDNNPDPSHNKNCDMQSAGYRLLSKEGKNVLQIAVKLYEGQTTWNTCEVNVQIDADKDGKTDQELAGLPMQNLPGLSGDQFVSLLLNGSVARDLRKKFEIDFAANPDKAQEDYTGAVIDRRAMTVFDNSTLAIIEADVSVLSLADTGELNIKISTTHQDSGIVEYDDYLEKHADSEALWEKISVYSMGQAFTELPEEVVLAGQENVTIPLVKGYGNGDLILYAPQNKSVRDPVLEDAQSQQVPLIFSSEL